MPVTFENVRTMALALENVVEGTSYGTPAFRVKDRLFARFRPDLNSLVVRMGFEERAALLEEDPKTFFITEHYRNYRWVLVRMDTVSRKVLANLLAHARTTAGISKRGGLRQR